MEQNYLIGAMAMLAKLNEATRKKGWFIDANTDGKTFELWATKDDPKLPKKYPLGELRMTTEQFFCTMAILVNAYENDSLKSMVARDVIDDYVQYVIAGKTEE